MLTHGGSAPIPSRDGESLCENADNRLLYGRGSVNCCINVAPIPSRAREQAVFRLFQQP